MKLLENGDQFLLKFLLKMMGTLTPNEFVYDQINGSACSVLFFSTKGLFLARREILEHETQSSALTFF